PDFSSRLTLAFAPFQPFLSRCALCLRRKSSILRSSPPLEISCLSFRTSLRLFSRACSLFVQNAGVGIPLRSVLLRQTIDLLLLCFHILMNCFFRKPFILITICVARGCHSSRHFF